MGKLSRRLNDVTAGSLSTTGEGDNVANAHRDE